MSATADHVKALVRSHGAGEPGDLPAIGRAVRLVWHTWLC